MCMFCCHLYVYDLQNIFVEFDGRVFRTNCAPLLADLFLYSHESEFIQGLQRNNKTKLSRSFNFTFRYIDDVLSLNNPTFSEHLYQKYPSKLEIREKTDSTKSVSYLNLLLESYKDGNLFLRFRSYCKLPIFMWQYSCFPCLWFRS